jgi:ABC-type cobalamin/Fe3+-siderophores transport system ATPase subunit
MLNSIRFKIDYRCFKEGTEFTLKDGLNLIVGDNGCGKSTLLELLINQQFEKRKEVLDYELDKPSKIYLLDFERQNPRKSSRIEHAYEAAMLFISHGESNNHLISTINKIEKDSIVLLDEPDMSLSIKSISKLYKTLKKNSKTKQILCSVHNPLLISYVHEVLSLEHGKWMSSEEFIQLSKA